MTTIATPPLTHHQPMNCSKVQMEIPKGPNIPTEIPSGVDNQTIPQMTTSNDPISDTHLDYLGVHRDPTAKQAGRKKRPADPSKRQKKMPKTDGTDGTAETQTLRNNQGTTLQRF